MTELSKEIIRIDSFYSDCFLKKYKPNWSFVDFSSINLKFQKLEYVFSILNEDEILRAYKFRFGEDSVWNFWDTVSDKIDIHTQQTRPNRDYMISHAGGLIPDVLGVNYDGAIRQNYKIMVPKEGIIAAFRFRHETGKMLDVNCFTRFAAPLKIENNFVMSMGTDEYGRFRISRSLRSNFDPSYGVRLIEYF